LKISVIIPTRNRASVLHDALLSLEKQTLSKDDFEVIVSDNASADNTREIAEEFSKNSDLNVLYVREDRLGLHFARHAGAKAASAEILLFTDDDMDFDPYWLEAFWNVFNSDSTIDCAGGRILIRWDGEPPSWILPYEGILGRLDYGPEIQVLTPLNLINGGSFCIKKKKLFEAGGFNPDQVNDVLIGDGETGLCYKIHKAGWKMVWVPAAIAWHLQKVSKNATLSDMKRRFANNGVSSAYHYFKYIRPSRLKLLYLSIYNYLAFLKFILSSLVYRVRNMTGYIDRQLKAARNAGTSRYFFRLVFSKDLRTLVLKDDWLN
jgi:glycosyltransferase involved in cell wall biosynthesis